MDMTLLRGGTVLIHNDQDEIEVIQADVLVKNGLIDQVAPKIQVTGDIETIDCSNKLVTPGFVNTHHHVWQTQLKGIHANQTLLEYLPCGNMSSCFYSPTDVFWGQLAGMLEALNGGITTTLDYSHINYSPSHVTAALQASEASGMRSIYAYTPTPRAKFDQQGAMELLPFLEPWIMDTFDELAATKLGIRTSLGFAFDGFFLPAPVLRPLFQRVHATPNVRVITLHDNSNASTDHAPSKYAQIVAQDLLDPKNETNWVLVHSTNLQDQPINDVKKHKMHISITPASELSMGMGVPVPVALDRTQDGIAPQVSIGVDCHSIAEAFIPGQLRSQLFAIRQHTHAEAGSKNQWYGTMDPLKGRFAGPRDAFNLATIGGARALGMENEIGRIKPGYRADLVVWDKRSPSMVAAAEQDPLAAIIIHAQPADVHAVLIDGLVRKMDGKLVPVQVKPPPPGSVLAKYDPPIYGEISWEKVADELLKSRERIMIELNKIDLAKSCNMLVNAFHYNKAGLLDPVTK